jgi:enoyl-CoA hydratase
MLTGRLIGARRAERIGLVSRVTPDGQVIEAALETADRMCQLSPCGLAMTKRAMWANIGASILTAAIDLENRNQLLLGFTPNLDEAKAAFRERAPAALHGLRVTAAPCRRRPG